MRAPTWAESYLDLQWVDDIEIGATDECWRWLGSHDEDGYGRRGRRLVHRLVADLFGFVADHVHHRCENTGCVNPMHLQPFATQGEHSDQHFLTHCKRGHPFTDENSMWRNTGGYWTRTCRVCHRYRARIYKTQKNHGRGAAEKVAAGLGMTVRHVHRKPRAEDVA